MVSKTQREWILKMSYVYCIDRKEIAVRKLLVAYCIIIFGFLSIYKRLM